MILYQVENEQLHEARDLSHSSTCLLLVKPKMLIINNNLFFGYLREWVCEWQKLVAPGRAGMRIELMRICATECQTSATPYTIIS